METRLNLVGRHTLAESVQEKKIMEYPHDSLFQTFPRLRQGNDALALQTTKNKPKVLFEKVPCRK